MTAAGLVRLRRARSTGLEVGLYDGLAAGMDVDGGRWQTVCEVHGYVCSHTTLRTAREFQSAPEQWCEECGYMLGGCCPSNSWSCDRPDCRDHSDGS